MFRALSRRDKEKKLIWTAKRAFPVLEDVISGPIFGVDAGKKAILGRFKKQTVIKLQKNRSESLKKKKIGHPSLSARHNFTLTANY